MIEQKLYLASEAAKMLGVHANTIKEWHRHGKINGVQVGRGWIRIPQSEIDRIKGGVHECYIRPSCPVCKSKYLSEVLVAGNGYECLDCGCTFFMTIGKPRKDIFIE